MTDFSLRHLLAALLLGAVLGGSITGCEPDSPALTNQPALDAEANFAYEPPPYDPCQDPFLKYEIGLEGRERQAKCEALSLAKQEKAP